jgi:nucleotide-binding universal stress UspA family protein
MKAPERILVPTDFSPFADRAVEQAAALARQYKAELYLLHVVQDIQQCVVDYCLTEELVTQYRNSGIDGSKAKLQTEIEKHTGAKDLKVVADVRVGTPYEEILKEEQEKKIDLIVIATHGKTGILHNLMGSVAERVSRGAKCPVMLVKA